MRSTRFHFRKSRSMSLVLVLAAFVSAPLAAQPEADAILKCASMKDDAARLACYDSLNSPSPPAVAPAEPIAPAAPAVPAAVVAAPAGQTATAVPAASAASPAKQAAPGAVAPAAAAGTVAQPPVESAPDVLNDEIGRERIGPKEGEELLVRGQVVSCREDLNSKYVFYFSNGQVWRQKGNARVPWKECDFEVTISKDFFGYKMVRDGDDKKIRIAREQ